MILSNTLFNGRTKGLTIVTPFQVKSFWKSSLTKKRQRFSAVTDKIKASQICNLWNVERLFRDTGTFYVMKDVDLIPLEELFRAEVFKFLKKEIIRGSAGHCPAVMTVLNRRGLWFQHPLHLNVQSPLPVWQPAHDRQHPGWRHRCWWSFCNAHFAHSYRGDRETGSDHR